MPADTDQPTLAVTQADRDLAAYVVEILTDDEIKARAYESCERDHWPLVQRIARHRTNSEPRPAGDLREAITAAITRADAGFGYSYRLTKMDDTGEEHTLFMDGFEPAVFEDREDGYPVLEERRNTLRADAVLAALATPKPPVDEAMREAASYALMYLQTGFVECPQCGHEVPTADLDATYTLAEVVKPAADGNLTGDGAGA